MEYSNLSLSTSNAIADYGTHTWTSDSITIDNTGSSWTTVYPNDPEITWITNQYSITDPT